MEQVQPHHFGLIEPTSFGWIGACMACGQMTTPHMSADAASRALVDLCATAEARAWRAEHVG